MYKQYQIIILAAFIIAFNISAKSQTGEWEKLIMLKSTRDEVEAILGKPEKFFDTSGTYTAETGIFSVWYSDGECKSDRTNQYLVPRGIVTTLRFTPKSRKPLKEHLGDNHEYTELNLDAIRDSTFWISKDGAVSYETKKLGGENVVFAIRLYPADNLQKQFACENKVKKEAGY